MHAADAIATGWEGLAQACTLVDREFGALLADLVIPCSARGALTHVRLPYLARAVTAIGAPARLGGALPLGPLALLGLPTFVGTLLLRRAGALLLRGTGALLLCGTRALLLCGTRALLLFGGALAGRAALLHGAALLLLLRSVGALRRGLRGALRRLSAGLGRGSRRGHTLLRCGAHARRRRLLSGATSSARAALSTTGLTVGTLSGGKTCPRNECCGGE
jgi:hypothetical protein